MRTGAIGMVRRFGCRSKGLQPGGPSVPLRRFRAGGTSTGARQRIPRRNLGFLCGVWPGRTPVEGMGTFSEPLSQPPRCGSVPAPAEKRRPAVEVGMGVGAQSSPRLWHCWPSAASASRWPASPAGTRAPSRCRILPRRCWHLPEGADGDGDAVRDVTSPADAVFGAANYLRQLRSGTGTRHLIPCGSPAPGGRLKSRCEPPLRSGSRWGSARPLTHPGRLSAVAPSDPMALSATFVAAVGW